MGSDAEPRESPGAALISIHAPRMGSDHGGRLGARDVLISIHAPRMGSDLKVETGATVEGLFQSTLPAWGATRVSPSARWRKQHFNPRSPHGERLHDALYAEGADPFQSTLPARGATTSASQRVQAASYFNPRSPHGERRNVLRHADSQRRISIHAPRTGSDPS